MYHPTSLSFGAIVQLALRHRYRWAIPAMLVTLLATTFAVLRPDTWEASQALIVRDEAIGVDDQHRAGQFEQVEQMAAVQETIMELARSRGVLEAALQKVGPSSGAATPNWPLPQDVKELRADVSLTPPQGAEFGKTEVFYLKVKNKDRERAVQLASAICEQLSVRFQMLRNDRAEGMVHELSGEVKLAQEALDRSTKRLASIESKVGSDLAELRILEKSPSGQSDLRQRANAIEAELRAAEEALRGNEELRRMLVQAQEDQTSLIATPNRLLESQPALRRLKDGLIDAQLRTAQLLGRMSQAHPHVLAAIEAEQEVKTHLHDEIAIAIRGIETDVRLTQSRVDALTQQIKDVNGRLESIATKRADYANLIEEIAQKTKVLNEAEKQLAGARSSHAAAYSTSLLHQIDKPDTGADPIGPSRSVIVAAGLFGGLLVGGGILLMIILPRGPAGTHAPHEDSLAPPLDHNEHQEAASFYNTGTFSIKSALRKLDPRGQAG